MVNAIVDVHADDGEFGYRFSSDEFARAGHVASENRVERLWREHKVWSTTVKKGRKRPGGTPDPSRVALVVETSAVFAAITLLRSILMLTDDSGPKDDEEIEQTSDRTERLHVIWGVGKMALCGPRSATAGWGYRTVRTPASLVRPALRIRDVRADEVPPVSPAWTPGLLMFPSHPSGDTPVLMRRHSIRSPERTCPCPPSGADRAACAGSGSVRPSALPPTAFAGRAGGRTG